MEKRQHVRVSVQCRSHFSSKSQMVAGEGELRDLSPAGCRVTSQTAVPLGVEWECEGNPFIIEDATVRWTRPQEFGLAFTTSGRAATDQRAVQKTDTARLGHS
jgi:hypothetical protein